MIIEPIGTPECFVEGVGNFVLKNGVLRFACYSTTHDGNKVANIIVRTPIETVLAGGADVRALLGDTPHDLIKSRVWM